MSVATGPSTSTRSSRALFGGASNARSRIAEVTNDRESGAQTMPPPPLSEPKSLRVCPVATSHTSSSAPVTLDRQYATVRPSGLGVTDETLSEDPRSIVASVRPSVSTTRKRSRLPSAKSTAYGPLGGAAAGAGRSRGRATPITIPSTIAAATAASPASGTPRRAGFGARIAGIGISA